MVNESDILNLIQESKKSQKDRKFKQALELYIVFKDIDVKKGFALNEVIQLPKQMTKPAAVCVMATGDMSLKAKEAKADQVLDNAELDNLAQNKRDAVIVVLCWFHSLNQQVDGPLKIIQAHNLFEGQPQIASVLRDYC